MVLKLRLYATLILASKVHVVVLVVIGTFGRVTKRFDKWIDKVDIKWHVIELQKTAMLETARILRKVLER